MNNIVKKLMEMKKENNDAVQDLINILIAHIEIDEMDEAEARRWLNEIIDGGCNVGIISDFIYHVDCKEFFIKHIDNVLETLAYLNYQDELDVTQMVWVFVEYQVSYIYDELFVY